MGGAGLRRRWQSGGSPSPSAGGWAALPPRSGAKARLKSLEGHFDPQFRGWDLVYTDVKRAERFIEELRRYEQEGDWPAFITLRLPNDHTAGMSKGKPTPTASEPSGDDPNHVDGIGTLHLTSYFYPATHPGSAGLQGYLGGGDPDFRDARVSLSVRGNEFVPNGAELVWWTQSDNDIAKQLTADWRRANWAYTGFSLTDALLSGKWEPVTFRLKNDSHAWSYGGYNTAQNRPNYAYDSINNSLGHLSCDFFHLLVFVNPQQQPTGSIDLDEFTVAYRNYSLVHPANGGQLAASPADGLDDPARLIGVMRRLALSLFHVARGATFEPSRLFPGRRAPAASRKGA